MPLQLFSARACPFAQRARAVLEELHVPFELREIDLANKPPDFVAVSPTGKVPLLVDGRLKLYESFILTQYLAEQHGWSDALAADPGLRARQRLAMLQFDAVVIPAFFRALKEGPGFAAEPALDRELDELQATAAETPVRSLLGVHVATFWLRIGWLRAHAAKFVERIDARPALRRWLDEAVALAGIQRTAPDREETITGMRRRFAGAG